MTLGLVPDPELTDRLREELLALWIDVANEGGAVGFAGTRRAGEVGPVADGTFAAVTEGADRLLVGYHDGRAVAPCCCSSHHRFALADHWRTVKRVMVHPDLQGRAVRGGADARGGADGAPAGLAALHVTVRDGNGVERFYTGLGYHEVGRLPGALRVAPGDDRDEIHMWLPLG